MSPSNFDPADPSAARVGVQMYRITLARSENIRGSTRPFSRGSTLSGAGEQRHGAPTVSVSTRSFRTRAGLLAVGLVGLMERPAGWGLVQEESNWGRNSGDRSYLSFH